MRNLYKAGVSLVAITLIGCAGPSTQAPGVSSDEIAVEKARQQAFMVQTYAEQLARLDDVAFRLTVANQRDCGAAVARRIGIHTVTPSDLPENGRTAWIQALNLQGDRTTVISVAASSPAAKAQLRKGDVLISIDGESIPSKGVEGWLAERLRQPGTKKFHFVVEHNGQNHSFDVESVASCSIPVVLAQNNEVNAFTDGKKIVIHSGIMRVAQSDAELALVVGHELAHVTMGHLRKAAQNQVAGAVGGAVVDVLLAVGHVNTGGAFTRQGGAVGAVAYAKDFEKEADYVGAYYAARAGYEISGSERLWRAVGQEDPKQLAYAGLHPTSPERFVQMQKTTEEIRGKVQRHANLNPEVKSQAVEADSVDQSSANTH